MAKKLLALLLALVMVLAIAACTPAETPDTKPNTGNDTPKDTTPKDTEEQHEPVTIEILIHNDEGLMTGLANVNKLFTEKYPWITVEVEAVAGDQIGAVETARFAAKDCDIIRGPSFTANINDPAFDYIPDGVFSTPTAIARYEEGLYLDLSDISTLSNWGDSVWDQCEYDGKKLAVPTGTVIGNGIWYNKTMFDKYELSVPKTYEEFITVCETLKENGENVLITGMLDNWPPMMLTRSIAEGYIVDQYDGTSDENIKQWCEDMWTGKASFDDEVALECWKRIDEVNQYWCDASYNCNLDAATSEFINGNGAMLVNGSWALTAIAEGADFEYGMFAIPGSDAPEGEQVYFSGRGDITYAVCSGTKYPEECKLWVEFYSTPEGYAAFLEGAPGFLPFPMEGLSGLNDFAASIQPGMSEFYIQMESCFKAPSGTGQWANFNAGVTGLKSCLGDMTVEELAAAAAADWELAMEQAGMR